MDTLGSMTAGMGPVSPAEMPTDQPVLKPGQYPKVALHKRMYLRLRAEGFEPCAGGACVYLAAAIQGGWPVAESGLCVSLWTHAPRGPRSVGLES
jgi:hypothetical protein